MTPCSSDLAHLRRLVGRLWNGALYGPWVDNFVTPVGNVACHHELHSPGDDVTNVGCLAAVAAGDGLDALDVLRPLPAGLESRPSDDPHTDAGRFSRC